MRNASDLQLRVQGKKYSGWKSIRATRSIETLCGSFALSASDRWAGQSKPWPIREEDECAVILGDSPVVVGYVDKVSPSFSDKDHSLSVAGRDKTSALIDCSADLGKWEFANLDLKAFAEKLVEPYGLQVLLQPGLKLERVPKFSIDPGETAFEALEKACRLAGVLIISDQGDLRITRAAATRAKTALVEGENILAASGEFDASERFAEYKVLGQHRGTDDFFGDGAAATVGVAKDSGVRRKERKRIIRADGNATSAQAKLRAQWEAIVRAGRAQAVSIAVQGWTMGDGDLWPINALVPVRSPWLGIDSDMLIVEVAFSCDESGTTTQLSLKRPDAFKPEPTATGKGGKAAPWLTGGADQTHNTTPTGSAQ